jgi:anti-sigma factor RsiW
MTCSDVDQLLDSFVDTELPPGEMIAVARHAGTCAACDATIRDFEAMRHVIGTAIESEVDSLDLSGIWPQVAVGVDAAVARRARWMSRRRLSAAPVWGAALALAASIVVFVMRPADLVKKDLADVQRPRPASRLASLPNYAQIERLAGKNIAVRREPKDGTTMIWVNHQVADAR